MSHNVEVVWSLLSFITFAAAAPQIGHIGSRDEEFARVPFNEWIAEGKPGSFKWSMHVTKPQLSVHQRLSAQIEVAIDGVELAKRRGQGQLLIFVQIKDAKDNVYRDLGNIDLEK